MKKVILIFVSFAIFTIVGCREDKAKTETVIIEKHVEAPKKESNGTSLSVDGDGVQFSTKDGDKKTEIKIGD